MDGLCRVWVRFVGVESEIFGAFLALPCPALRPTILLLAGRRKASTHTFDLSFA